MSREYDFIVIGAGHAGCEAALAAARLGLKTLVLTLSLDNVGFMPCNPSLGGPAKGHLVTEIDALGGEMGIIGDRAAIQMRLLNMGKGPAVRALRAQADKNIYHTLMKETLENQDNLYLAQGMAEELLLTGDAVRGVRLETGEELYAPLVLLATGTYLRSKIVYGEVSYDSGPNGMRAAGRLSLSLARLGLRLMRFKSGTPARVDKRSLDFSRMKEQRGDEEERHFSFLSRGRELPQRSCWLTYTNEKTHRVIRDNLSRAALFSGLIEGTGPRYCPSIEAKIVRFAERERHQLFLEPEGLSTNEMYVQGMSTSLPADVQQDFLSTIAGLENVRIMRPGYAIDYDCLDPLQLGASLEHKEVRGLFSAGQANGTSGYEEAAAQGIMAGINAARRFYGRPTFVLGRSDAYIGVLIDDLVTKGTEEPYRMMTSRAEYRLLLRQDNADLRLTAKGRELGLVDDRRYAAFTLKRDLLQRTRADLEERKVSAGEAAPFLQALGQPLAEGSLRLVELLRRPGADYGKLSEFFRLASLPREVAEELEIMVKYEGYIKKQSREVERAARLESKRLPPDADYAAIREITMEAREKLNLVRPATLGQAARISGVSPADISVLLVWLEGRRRRE